MDNTNRAIKICRRIIDIELALDAKDQKEREYIELQEELINLETEYETLRVANHRVISEM